MDLSCSVAIEIKLFAEKMFTAATYRRPAILSLRAVWNKSAVGVVTVPELVL